ncbi:MAG TPA: serine/threonine-protein kinase, partial [Polyangiaceae bacterium]
MAREPNDTEKRDPDGCGDVDASDLGARAEVIGRYTLHARIASGGMASVYLGSLAGVADFSRLVAIKRMHPQFAADPEFSERFRDEARLTARLLHPNIVQSLDVVQLGGELLLIMEYVDGVTLNSVCHDASASGLHIPLKVVSGILVPVLHGLHAAHAATDDEGHPLGIVHRDFSPQNIIIGRDGHTKILDFGIAKARTHHHVTVAGQFSGKFGYLSPEQINGKEVDQRTDVFAAGVVLWELLTCKRLFREPGLSEGATVERVLNMEIPRPSQFNSEVDDRLDQIVLRALQREPSRRFATAHELAVELEAVHPIASPSH